MVIYIEYQNISKNYIDTVNQLSDALDHDLKEIEDCDLTHSKWKHELIESQTSK